MCDFFLNERAFSIVLEDEFQIVFKWFGNQSNILLVGASKVIDLFHKRYSKDYSIDVAKLNRYIDQSLDSFKSRGLQSTFPTLGSKILNNIKSSNRDDKDLQWKASIRIIEEIEKGFYYIVKDNEDYGLSLINQKDSILVTSNVIKASRVFYSLFIENFQVKSEKIRVERMLKRRIFRLKNYRGKNEKKLFSLRNENNYKYWGDILMCNLNRVLKDTCKVVLYNYYTNTNITIPINKNISLLKNAENFYRKSKNQNRQLQTLDDNIEKSKTEEEKNSFISKFY